MIVEKPDILKQWMTEVMEPMCDAEPAKLAKYVLALIKKDMPTDQLRQSMKSNLDIFLHDQAGPFVEKLFATLETKAYLPQPSPDSTTPVSTAPPPPPPPPVAAPEPPVAPAAAPAPAPHRRVEPEPPAPAASVRDRLGRRPLSRQRDRDDRGERRRSWEDRRRDRRSPPPPPRDRRPARRSRSPPPPRMRHIKSRSVSRPRSKSPLGAGGKPRAAPRSPKPRSRSRSPRSPPRRSPPPLRRSLSRSRTRSPPPRSLRSKSPIKFERTPPKEPTGPAPAGAAKDAPEVSSAEKTEPATGGAPAATGAAGAAPVTDLRNKLQTKQRCRDYDEKGLCMRGDQCPYDHGADPVILQDVSMPLDMLKYSAPPPTISVPPPGVPAAPPLPGPLTHPPPGGAAARFTMLEPYNPDAPSLTVGSGPRPSPAWPYSQPPPPMPHVRPPFFPGGAPTVLPPMTAGGDRQLLSVRVAPPPGGAAVGGPRGRHPFPAGAQEPPRKRGHFDMSRLGGGAPRPRFDPMNSSLELRKVPAGMNQITHLNNHFAKFGKITNIQVSYNGDPEAALVTFSVPAEAKAAYKCTEAVLNNRFIKVFWHNKEQKEDLNGTSTEVLAGAGGQLTRTVTNPEALKQQQEQVAAAKQQTIDAINHSQQMLAAKVSLHTKTLEKQKEARKLAADLRKRKADLLEKQLSQQKALLGRLESKTLKPDERKNIVATVKELQKAIEGTRAAVKSAVDAQPAAAAGVHGRPVGREATEKEVLDAEMDLYQKQQAGVDTSQLQRRVAELHQQLTTLRGRGGPTPAAAAAARGRGFVIRGGRGARGRGSMSYVPGNRQTQVDRRPTKLHISGFELDERQALLMHLAQFGEIVSHDDDDVTPSVVVAFSTRAEAEAALARGRHFNDRLLTANWHTAPAPPPPPAVQPSGGGAQTAPQQQRDLRRRLSSQMSVSSAGERALLAEVEADADAAPMDADADHLLAGDDDEDDEDADERSWRR